MNVKRTIKTKTANLLIRMFRLVCGVKSKKVLIESFYGKSYSDNPRAVSEALQKYVPEAEIVWALNDPDAKKRLLPQGVRVINRRSKWNYYKELATCGAFVTNFTLPLIPKGKKQYFIQTWHGDRGFKKILLDATVKFVPEQVDGYCDLAVTGSKYGEMQFRSAFHYNGELLQTGTPRNDRLMTADPEEKEKIRTALHVPEGARILLYAPTLRDKECHAKTEQNVQDIDLMRTMDCLKEKYGSDWVCFVRAHPGMVGLCGVEKNDRIVNVSSYGDMGDLLLISDLLITDYSSSAGDFVLMNKPVILFQSDKQDYVENSRELYFDMESTPFYIAESQAELERLIDGFTEESVTQNCKAVLDFYGAYESGNAARNVAEKIAEHMNT